MHTLTGRRHLLAVWTVLLGGAAQLGAQQLPPPDLRIADAVGRAARVLDSVARFDPATRATYVHSDTTRGGVTWIHFEPTAVPRAQRARTPAAAAASFLARYGTKVFGVDPELGRLELLRVQEDGHLHHLRYAQHHAGYRVLHGQLIVHVQRIPGGYAVKSANGWLFPDVVAPPSPSLTRSGAETAALFALTGARANTARDTAPVIVAHDGSYRLAYLIPVSGGLVNATRHVDAVSGVVFAESPTHDEFAGNGSVRAPAPSILPERRAHLLAKPANPSIRSTFTTGFEAAEGVDWKGNSRAFRVWLNGSTYELADDEHAGASQVRIHDFDGAGLTSGCDDEEIVERSSATWPENAEGKEEVSAVHNLGESVSYFKNAFGRNGMHNDGAPLYACVHGVDTAWNATYSPSTGRLSFREETGADGPSVAAQDVATHEFTHGVTHTEVAFATSNYGPRSINEALADYFGVRHNGGNRCRAEDVIGVRPCSRYLSVDSITSCAVYTYPYYPNVAAHCFGIRLSSALLDAVEANSGAAEDEVDYVAYTAIGYYMTSLMDLYDAAHTIVSYAHDHVHQGAYEGLVNASPALEAALFNSGLQYHGWINVQMSGSYEWTITLGNNTNWDPYDITFEIGSQGFNFDGSVAWPDSTIAVGAVSTDTATTFDQYDTHYHSCSDGHAHGFRATINDGNGWIVSYYAGQAGCGGSVMAGPAPAGAVPTRFAVRQAIQAPDGSPSALSSSPPALTLGAQIRQYGLTALDVDIPDGTALASIEVTVYTPQGRVIRRFVTDRVGPGTQRVPWDRKDDGGRDAPAGVYVVVVRHGSQRHRTHFVIPAER